MIARTVDRVAAGLQVERNWRAAVSIRSRKPVPLLTPPMVSLCSRIRPIMSILIIAIARDSGNGGSVVNSVEPRRPISSPANATKTTPRCS